ncbi:uncharacterized protein ycf23 [Cryptomeria japonica]|uniref:uncharacterized protein ycf23 n=1 Tax=Cryptomeria japonica TaxID=3369 RepID=UPI0025AC3C4D|nr:uncharacterized protein ycf23 [Cryptomeria japonica]
MQVVMANSYAILTTTTTISPSSFHSTLCTPFKVPSTISTRQHKLIAKRYSLTVKAASTPGQRDFVLEDFYSRRALKIISGLRNFNKEIVASVVIAAQKGGATHVDIACDPELVKLAISLTCLPVCVSAVEPEAFVNAVEAGAQMVEIGNYDSFYETGRIFSPEEILQLTMKTRQLLPSVVLSVTVPHTLSLTDQVTLAESLETEGVDIIQTEGGTSSDPSYPGVHGLIEKAVPTLAAAYSISRAVRIPVMCASGLSSVTAPMAIAAGAAGVGVGSAVNKLNNQVAMIAEVKSLADALGLSSHVLNGSFISGNQRSVPTI